MDRQIQHSSLLQSVIHDYEVTAKSKFTPTKDFYKSMGINRIRFWQLIRGEKTLFVDEAARLSDFFGIAVQNLIPTKSDSR